MSMIIYVEHLIKVGCKRIAHIAGPETLNIARERKRGYIEALIKNNLNIEDELIVTSDLNKVAARESTQKLLDLKNPPDAIFCAANPLGAYLEIKERKILMPQDIALIGFTDDPLTSFTEKAESYSSLTRFSPYLQAAGS